MFLSHLLRGPLAACLSLPFYVAPGVVVATVLSFLLFNADRPVWADGVIHGVAASALGFFCVVCIRNVPTTRKTRLGPVAALAAFLAQALLQLDIVVIMATVGLVSVYLNRPKQIKKESA